MEQRDIVPVSVRFVRASRSPSVWFFPSPNMCRSLFWDVTPFPPRTKQVRATVTDVHQVLPTNMDENMISVASNMHRFLSTSLRT